LSASAWQFPYFITYNFKSASSTFFWYKLAYIGLISISPATYNFIISFLHLRRKNLVSIFYGISCILVLILLTSDYIIAGVRPFSWGNCALPGKAYTLFLIVVYFPHILALKCLYTEYRKAKSPYDKKRIKYFLISLPIAYLCWIDVLPIYGVKIYPFGFIPLMFFGLATTYAIIRYRLLDIEIMVKKASLIIFGFVTAMSLVYLGTSYLQPYFHALLGRNWIILPIFIALLVGQSLFKFINFVRQLEEEELSKRFTYRRILRKEAERVSQANDTHELITYTVRDLSSWMHLSYVGVYTYNAQNKEFVLAKKIMRKKNSENISLPKAFTKNNPLVKALIDDRKALIQSELQYYLNTKTIPAEKIGFLYNVVEKMRELNAEIAIPSFCEGELLAVIALGHKLNLNEIITREDLEVLTSLSSHIARALHGFLLKTEKTRLIVASQNTVISAIEAKDNYTRGHTNRVAHYTSLIAKRSAGLLRNLAGDLTNINWSAQLHDVGKIAIPDNILFKPGPLNEQEWLKVKEHPLNGIKIITPVKEWLGEDICAGIIEHHENYDGSGYPFRKRSEEIHIFARIIRVADSFDAMTSERPYRRPLTQEEAMGELERYKGLYFDPGIVKIIQDLYKAGELNGNSKGD
jgi:HD-GYP domain-containing protein (c-di-GMP phosphodiesterase class II)